MQKSAISISTLALGFAVVAPANGGLFSRHSAAAFARDPDQQAIAHLEQTHGGLWHDAQATERLKCIGAKLQGATVDSVRCTLRLLDADESNAYSLSCGCVYVTRGLYRRLTTDDMVAAVLAHEMSHVAAQDGKHPCSDSACQLEKERRADARAVRLLQKAGYPPTAMLKLVELLKSEQPAGWALARRAALEAQLASQSADGLSLSHVAVRMSSPKRSSEPSAARQ